LAASGGHEKPLSSEIVILSEAKNPGISAQGKLRDESPFPYQPSLKSFQPGFILSIKAVFFARNQPLIRFSFAMASPTWLKFSKYIRRFML
jgi:hypothetical protein